MHGVIYGEVLCWRATVREGKFKLQNSNFNKPQRFWSFTLSVAATDDTDKKGWATDWADFTDFPMGGRNQGISSDPAAADFVKKGVSLGRLEPQVLSLRAGVKVYLCRCAGVE
jgi:hypothetical protein